MNNHDSNSEFQDFLKELYNACEKIQKDYFYLPVYGNEEAVYRERVYCYELYHQLRVALDENFNYVLNGEVAKKGHPVLRKDVTPDFLIHVPGRMDKNLVVMEVKSTNDANQDEDFSDDIDKILMFIREMNYQYGIYLIYGRKERIIKRIKTIINEKMKGYGKDKILLLWHREPNCKPIPCNNPL